MVADGLRLDSSCGARTLAAVLLSVLPQTLNAISVEELLRYRHLSDVRVAPDGDRVAFVVSENDLVGNAVVGNLWIVKLPNGRAFQLTAANERVAAPTWAPDGERLAFVTNRDGPHRIWTISPDGGEAKPAVPVERLSISQYQWLPDGSGFLFLAQDPPPGARRGGRMPRPGAQAQPLERPAQEPIVVDADPRYARLYRFRSGDNRPERVTREDYHVTGFDRAPDASQVVLSTQPRPGPEFSMNSKLRLLDVSSGQVADLQTQRAPISAPKFSPNGQWVAYISQRDPGDGSYNVLNNRYLQVVRPDGSDRRFVSDSVDDNVLGFEWTGDSKALTFWVFEGVTSKVYRVALSSGKPEVLDAFKQPRVLARGQGVSFSTDGQVGAAAISDATTPAELYLLESGGRRSRKLTELNGDFARVAPHTEVLNYRSRDSLDLEALVVKPRAFEDGQTYPLLVIVHGGPPGVFTYAFLPRIGVYPLFAFADAGYVVLLPNPRGSTGYGEQFRRANIKDLGGRDFEDIMAGVDLLIERGVADPDRLGLMGWSYGGYMGNWVVTHSNRFKAVSSGAAISNLTSHHGTGQVKGYGLHDSIWGVSPWEDTQLYVEHSALFSIQDARTPLLIQHGDKDPVVPLSQAEEMYAAAKRVGLPVQMVIYPGQGHAIQTPKLVLDGMQRNLRWFNKWLAVE
jgi:dipeptidyl aminopeptidase/acylaminoacyl peptidase